MKEAQLEQRFYRPILEVLGFFYEVQEGVASSRESPDYALFADAVPLESKRPRGTTLFDRAIALAEVKRWGIELDRFGKDKHDKRRNPSFQIWLYLHQVKPSWGILTNGIKWRLYHRNFPLDCYLEVDLVEILESGNIDRFKYFFYFFRKDAFSPADGSFIESVLVGSTDYAQELSENLEDQVYRALTILAKGFFSWSDNQLIVANDDHRRKVQTNVMRLLYRVLFVLYAEGRGLLGDKQYLQSDHSFHKLKHEIAEKLDSGVVFSPSTKLFWFRLKELFRLIDKGSETLGIRREQFYVPSYNGGLFDTGQGDFLENYVVGDYALSRVIDLLSRSMAEDSKKGFVDFSTLSVQHLGGIYEGLLEYNIEAAVEKMVATGKNLKWASYAEYSVQTKKPVPFESFSQDDRAEAGGLYLATTAGERKASGSFYTPQHVVAHIIERALDPIFEQRWAAARSESRKLSEATLSLRVLDPAMGSGHFLVAVVEYLAPKLLQAIHEDAERGLIAEQELQHFTPDWAKREVLSHCVYGVDLNELAVELAKVSLWLITISKEKPLGFLDHHLKCGNSLVGAMLYQLKNFPDPRQRKRAERVLPDFVSQIFVERLIAKIHEIESIRDDSVEEVKKKEQIFKEFKELPEYQKARGIADVHTSLLCGNQIPETSEKPAKASYYDLVFALDYPEKWIPKSKTEWFRSAVRLASGKKFFHWELEFPEIFFDSGGIKSDAGFDAVVGNPPYLNVKRGALASDAEYLRERFQLAEGQWDAFALFYERSMELLRSWGQWSMIIPKPALSSENYEPLRRLWLQKHSLEYIADAGTPFDDPAVETIIAQVARRRGGASFKVAEINSNGSRILWELTKDLCLKNPFAILSIRMSPEKQAVTEHFISGETLASLFEITRGIEAGKNAAFVLPSGLGHFPLVFGEDLVEYASRSFYSMNRELPEVILKPKELYAPPKLLIRRVASRLVAAVDYTPAHVLNTIYVGRPKSASFSLNGIAAYLNSTAVNFWFHHVFVFEDKLFPYVRVSQLEQIPTPSGLVKSRKLEKLGRLIPELIQKQDLIVERVALSLEAAGLRFQRGGSERFRRGRALLAAQDEERMTSLTMLFPEVRGTVLSKKLAAVISDFSPLRSDFRNLEESIRQSAREIDDEVFSLLKFSKRSKSLLLGWRETAFSEGLA